MTRYGLTEGLKQYEMQRVVRAAVEQGVEFVPDPLPAPFAIAHSLIGLRAALRQVHEPKSVEDYEAARRRLLFDDLLEFQVGVALRRRLWGRRSNAPVLPVTAKIDARIRRLFPFPFTAGQDAAIREITADLQSGRAMHRLLSRRWRRENRGGDLCHARGDRGGGSGRADGADGTPGHAALADD